MSNIHRQNKSDNLSMMVGQNTVIQGDIIAEGYVMIDGKVFGDITVEGEVFISNNANISGNIDAHDIKIAGNVEGDVRSSGVLRLMPTGKISGDVVVSMLLADEGSTFEGNCSMSHTPKTKARNKDIHSEEQSDRFTPEYQPPIENDKKVKSPKIEKNEYDNNDNYTYLLDELYKAKENNNELDLNDLRENIDKDFKNE